METSRREQLGALRELLARLGRSRSPTSTSSQGCSADVHARAGFGVTPVALRSDDRLPTAHHGMGAFSFIQFRRVTAKLLS